MADAVLLIKRSETVAVPSALANGELAFSGNSKVLYIGANGSIEPIGGKRFPGVLTANQGLVANATSYMDSVKTAKLFLTDTTANVTHINTVANATHIGAAVNTEVTSTWAIKTYVDGKVAAVTGTPGGANTAVQYNASGAFGGVPAFTFDSASNTAAVSNAFTAGANVILDTVRLFLGNSTVNVAANSLQVTLTDVAHQTTLNTSAIALGSQTLLQSGGNLFLGNTTANTIANSIQLTITGVASFAKINTTAFSAGSNVTLNTTELSIGNTTANLFANSILIKVANASGIANLQPTQLVIGASTLDATSLTTTDVTVTGNLTINGTLTNIDTVNLVVEDPLIKLAKNNNTGDTLDIGFYALLDPSGSQDTYSGLFRDATDDKYKLFHLLQDEPTTTVDIAGTGYAQAWLVCALESNNVNITGGTIDCGTFS